MDTPTNELDFSKRYRVRGYDGIAFYLVRYATKHEPIYDEYVVEYDGEIHIESYEEWVVVEDPTQVVAVMVGDDYEHTVDIEDLTPLERHEYCGECGQIGCSHDGLDRDG